MCQRLQSGCGVLLPATLKCSRADRDLCVCQRDLYNSDGGFDSRACDAARADADGVGSDGVADTSDASLAGAIASGTALLSTPSAPMLIRSAKTVVRTVPIETRTGAMATWTRRTETGAAVMQS